MCGKRFNLTSGLGSTYKTWIITTKSCCKVILNQRANRILLWDVWQKVQFWHQDLKVQEMNYHLKVMLQSYFGSKSEQNSVVRFVAKGSIWHLDLKVQDMNCHHNLGWISGVVTSNLPWRWIEPIYLPFPSRNHVKSSKDCITKTADMDSGNVLQYFGHKFKPKPNLK